MTLRSQGTISCVPKFDSGMTEQPDVRGTGRKGSGRSGSRSGAAAKAVKQVMSHLWALVFLPVKWGGWASSFPTVSLRRLCDRGHRAQTLPH